jgi:hypothetical protein
VSKAKTSEQAQAYTPGLKVKRFMIVSKERRLPVPGEVIVHNGEKVNHETVIAKAFIEGDAHVIDGADKLKVDPEDVVDYFVKKVGDPIKEGEVLLRYVAFFGLSKRIVTSPVTGTIEAASGTTGQIILRESPKPIHVDAYIPGEIVKVLPKEGAMIETRAAFIQGIFGIGGETHGRLKIVTDSPGKPMTAKEITESEKGCIIVGGSEVTLDALRRAVEIGVAGIIVGGIEPLALRDFTGEEIGVAITGQEELGMTLIITEGFGKMTMSDRTFNLLKVFDGYMAHINGATQIRAGVLRPEIVIPHEKGFKEGVVEGLSAGMIAGTPVRIIREPYFGAIGKVVSLPIELQQVESEAFVRVVEVELEDSRRVTIPRANVEIIEE